MKVRTAPASSKPALMKKSSDLELPMLCESPRNPRLERVPCPRRPQLLQAFPQKPRLRFHTHLGHPSPSRGQVERKNPGFPAQPRSHCRTSERIHCPSKRLSLGVACPAATQKGGKHSSGVSRAEFVSLSFRPKTASIFASFMSLHSASTTIYICIHFSVHLTSPRLSSSSHKPHACTCL